MARPQVLQGIDTLAYIRLLKNAATEQGQLVPYQTSLSFDPKRDSDTTKTKDGAVGTSSSLETEIEVEFVNNISKVSDDLYDALIQNEKVEIWIVNISRKNSEGKVFAWYAQGSVTEDSNDNDPDDNSTRDVTFSVDGTPQRGWLELPASAKEELAYVFRGLGVVSSSEETGNGTVWKDTDRGTGSANVEKA
mgnify:CR=1 FL=1